MQQSMALVLAERKGSLQGADGLLDISLLKMCLPEIKACMYDTVRVLGCLGTLHRLITHGDRVRELSEFTEAVHQKHPSQSRHQDRMTQ